MKAVCSVIVSWYSVALLGFLVYIRKGFLHMSGESALPSIDLNCPDENSETEFFQN